MNLRRIAKPVSAILLTVGLFSVGIAPADAGVTKPAGPSTNDTGWGFK
jgi:hypothetical protein